MLLQPHTKATDFQQICTYFIQKDYTGQKEWERDYRKKGYRGKERQRQNTYNDFKDLGGKNGQNPFEKGLQEMKIK